MPNFDHDEYESFDLDRAAGDPAPTPAVDVDGEADDLDEDDDDMPQSGRWHAWQCDGRREL